jgi:hypothetical protein
LISGGPGEGLQPTPLIETPIIASPDSAGYIPWSAFMLSIVLIVIVAGIILYQAIKKKI